MTSAAKEKPAVVEGETTQGEERAFDSAGSALCDVCVITTIHQDFDNRIYHRQINSLLDAGLSVCVVAPWDFSKRTRSDFSFVELPKPRGRAARVTHGWRTYRAARGVNARAYIFHDNDFLPWAWKLRRATGRPVVYDAHENIPEDILYKDWIPRFLRTPLSLAFRMIEEAIVASLKETIVAVSSLERRFRQVGARAVLVRNFSKFRVPAGFARERAILYTGEVSPDYGVYHLVEIAREMKRRGIDVPLRIVDRFREQVHIRDFVERAAREDGLRIEILDSVPAEHMPQILAKGCIGLSPLPDLPNKRLALPTKIFEYFAFGLPVVASDIEGTRQIMADDDLGFLLPADDYQGWVSAIQKLLDDPQLYAEYQRRGWHAVGNTFTWEAEERRLIEYTRALAAS